MSVDRRDARHPLEVLLAESGVTDFTHLTETHVPVETVTPSTLRHPRAEVLRTLDIHKQTLLNYHKEYGHLLQAQPVGPRGGWVYSDLDVEFIGNIKNAKNVRMRDGIAASQSERLAQLSAGVGKVEAEQINRELRAWSETEERVAPRVAKLLVLRPSLRQQSVEARVKQYYAAFHADRPRIADVGNDPVPKWATVERAFRRCRS